MENEGHVTDTEANETEPTELDVALVHNVLWNAEGWGSEMRALGSTEDAAVLLFSTENLKSVAIYK